MYLMYVDESGDTGHEGSPTDHFVLTGFVVQEADWFDYLERLIAFRRRMGPRSACLCVRSSTLRTCSRAPAHSCASRRTTV